MDPLVVPASEAVATPARTSQPVGEVASSLNAWLGAEPDSKEAAFIVSQIDGKTTLDAITQLKDIERRLGPPKFGETRTGKLYNYMKILATYKQSKSELDRLER